MNPIDLLLQEARECEAKATWDDRREHWPALRKRAREYRQAADDLSRTGSRQLLRETYDWLVAYGFGDVQFNGLLPKIRALFGLPPAPPIDIDAELRNTWSGRIRYPSSADQPRRTFSPGDTVRLRCSEVLMVIEDVDDEHVAYCSWLDKNNAPLGGRFAVAALVHAPPPWPT